MSGMTPARRVQLWRPGRIGYEPGLAWQLARSAAVAAGRAPEALALLEHLPVFTLGVRGKREHLLASPAALAGRGAAVVDSDRGGDVTFHGPGQLVGYPILHLHERGLGAASYVRALEATLIEALATFGVSGERVPGRPGVWAGGSKVAALGVRISRGVSRHGFALNVATDLVWFDAIVPCGIADAGVTSLERLLGTAPPMREVEDVVAAVFARLFDSALYEQPEAALPASVPLGVGAHGD